MAYRAEDDIRNDYFPIRHPDSDNFDREQVFGWLKDLIASDVRIVPQMACMISDGCAPKAASDAASDRLEEIGALATLVDENHTATASTRCAHATACPARMRRC